MATRARGGLPPMTGPLARGFAALASPRTAAAAGLVCAVVCAWGLTAGTPLAAARSPVLHLGATLLVFSLLARAVSGGRLALAPALVATGLLATGVGAGLAGRDQGEVQLGGAEAVEAYEVPVGTQRVAMHLGGVLSSANTPEGLALSVGVRDHNVGEAVLPVGSQTEVALGPWAIFLARTEPAGAPGGARLRLTPRGGGEAIERSVRLDSQLVLPDGSRLGLNRISADFGRALGPAAQVLPMAADAAPGVGESKWIFMEAPELDARVGTDAWVVELVGLEAAPRAVLGVRRRGPLGVLFVGIALMALGLLLGLRAASGTAQRRTP